MVEDNVTKTNYAQTLLDSLEEEVRNYEHLLDLLKEHQQVIIARDIERITEINITIDEQVILVESLRNKREEASANLQLSLALDPAEPLRFALAKLAKEVGKAIKLSIDKLVQLISKSQYIAKQNQIMIKRAALITEQLLTKISPNKKNTTYNCTKTKNSSFNTLGLINASA